MIGRVMAMTAVVLFVAGRAGASTGGSVGDEDRARALETELRNDAQLQNNEVSVDVNGNQVRLRGEVDSADERRHAEEVVKRHDPTVTIDNQLAARSERKAAPPAEPSPTDKTRQKGKAVAHKAEKVAQDVAEMATDAWITSKIKTQLLGTDGVHASGINVDTADSVVTLHGNVRSEPERQKVLAVARQTRGVIKVIDQLAVVRRDH
jgi:hyperosmotically inducible protein